MSIIPLVHVQGNQGSGEKRKRRPGRETVSLSEVVGAEPIVGRAEVVPSVAGGEVRVAPG